MSCKRVVYLIESECLIVVNHSDLDRFRKVQDRAFLYLDHILNGQRYFNAVAFVVCPEYDFLYRLDPFLCTGYTISLELVRSFISGDRKCGIFVAFLLSVEHIGRDCVLQVDTVSWEVQLCWIGIVGEHVAT
jgi:hypothetical protein